MADDAIFFEGPDGLEEWPASGYATEDELQGLIERHPELLGGAQMTPRNPRRFVLIGREVGVPDREGGSDRWSLDHLFVDQDAVPTLVEVKRAVDTRIRREVVGQHLDYAANGARYWPLDDLVARFEATQAALGRDPQEVLKELVGSHRVDSFWTDVFEHLKEGRIRLVFLADRIPQELRSIVEWLNEQTTVTEILAVEVAQYGEPGHRALVPRVIGATQRAGEVKERPPQAPGFEILVETASSEVREVHQRLETWAASHSDSVVTRSTPAARQYRTGDGTVMFQLYPGRADLETKRDAYLEFAANSLRAPNTEQGRQIANELVAAIDRLVDRNITAKAPWMSCGEVLAAWDDLVGTVLDPWLAAATGR